MEISNKIVLTAIIAPFITTLLSVLTITPSLVDLFVLMIMYAITGFGITVGYHRLLTHSSFKTYNFVKYAFAICGTMAVEGSPIAWVADHRKHHKYSDQPDDPHSPYFYKQNAIKGTLNALYHSHVGWLLKDRDMPDPENYCRDLCRDKGIVLISKLNLAIILAGLIMPMIISGLLGGNIITALVWGGLVRIFMVHHVTWCINSICHFYGTRDNLTSDKSTNVKWLAIPSLGESWHNNHHADPLSAAHGIPGKQLDLSFMLIKGLEKLGLAWDVKLPRIKKTH